MSRESEEPTGWERVKAVLAAAVAAAIVGGLIYFAHLANEHPQYVNWFGVAVAIGAAAAFELFKRALTVRSRHRDELATSIMITPVKVAELRELSDQIQQQRQVHDALEAAVELRLRELLLKRERDELQTLVADLLTRAEKLLTEEKLLALDHEANAPDVQADLHRAMDLLQKRPGDMDDISRVMRRLSFMVPLGLGPLFELGLNAALEQLRQARSRSLLRRASRAPDLSSTQQNDQDHTESSTRGRDPGE